MGMPGMGALRGAESQAIGQIEAQKSQVVSQIESQKSAGESKIKESIGSQLKSLKGQKAGLEGALAQLKAQRGSIPEGHPARAQVSEKISQYSKSLEQIKAAISNLEAARGAQLNKLASDTSKSKENVKKQLDNQKKQIIAKFAGQKLAMMQQMKMMSAGPGSPEGGKKKG